MENKMIIRSTLLTDDVFLYINDKYLTSYSSIRKVVIRRLNFLHEGFIELINDEGSIVHSFADIDGVTFRVGEKMRVINYFFSDALYDMTDIIFCKRVKLVTTNYSHIESSDISCLIVNEESIILSTVDSSNTFLKENIAYIELERNEK